MALANNTNAQAVHDALSAISQNVAALQAQQAALQQQMAANVHAAPTIATSVAPPSQIYIPPINAPPPCKAPTQQASRPPRLPSQPLNGEVEEEAGAVAGDADVEADAAAAEAAAEDAATPATPPNLQRKRT